MALFLNPHVSDVNVLIIDKKRFDVRGLKQFYLPLPHTNAIVFIVDEKDYSVTYHIFNLDTDEDIKIHALSSMFGSSIGFDFRDSVEKVSKGRIVLCNLEPHAKSTLPELSALETVKSLYYLDLEKKVAAELDLYLSKDGTIIDQRSYGEIPKQ